MLDGVAICKETIYDPATDRYAGFTYYGGAVPESCEQLATESLGLHTFLLISCQEVSKHS